MVETFTEQQDQHISELEARLVNKAIDWTNRIPKKGNAIHVPTTINHGKTIIISYREEVKGSIWCLTETIRNGSCNTQITLGIPKSGQSYILISEWDDFTGHVGMPSRYIAEQFHLERFNNLLFEPISNK